MAILNQIPTKTIPLSKTKFTKEERYQKDAPVQLAGYFLFKDSNSENITISKKISFGFRNLSNQNVIAIKGRFKQFDPFGENLGEVNYSLIEIDDHKPGSVTGEHLFMDCHLSTGTIEFFIDQVIFEDKTKWVATGYEFLSMAFSKKEIAESDLEVMKYGWGVVSRGTPLKNYYAINEHFYACPCGNVNPLDTKVCPVCKVDNESAKSFTTSTASTELVSKMVKEVLFQINRLFPDAVYLDSSDRIRFTENAVLFDDQPLKKLREFGTYWKGVHPLIKGEIKKKGDFLKQLDDIQNQLLKAENQKKIKEATAKKEEDRKSRNKLLLGILAVVVAVPLLALIVSYLIFLFG